MSTREQWVATWNALGAAAPAGVYEEVMARYAEPQRHYHTARHLEECFAELGGVRGEAKRPAEVELALWFHDAIYAPKRSDNEERSAEWARAVVARAGLAPDVGERVGALIMATRHDATPSGADACVLVDVDLSILGATPERFDEYERDVRYEYGWVPGTIFRRERRKILHRFLDRPRIFATDKLHAALEDRARANLNRSLRQLRPSRVPETILGIALAAIVFVHWQFDPPKFLTSSLIVLVGVVFAVFAKR